MINIDIMAMRTVTLPSRSHANDAGMDFYIPDFTDDFKKAFEAHKGNQLTRSTDIPRIVNDTLFIPAHSNAVIPSGICMDIAPGFMGLFLNRSSVAGVKDCLIGAQVIDSGYTGEVHIDLHNVSGNMITFKMGEKVSQMVIVPVFTPSVTLLNEERFRMITQERQRQAGSFGSTNKKPVVQHELGL
jgi:dUTP pyrophosphatase